MLDSNTKRRIDNCRDILVGKVPDPKSQVEQITIALIYKFMDDMDTEAEELGGSRTFFNADYEQYRWAEIFDRSLSGKDMLNLYSGALETMEKNPNIPQLFRNIFKNAYLPYRDPETLKAFLKEINEFSYDHSEKLGDAFEYLLSVLGSQGDAGQFRTPRHIIDFMVKVVDPKKDETILDPACGTAGFLISSYKHIIKHNSTSYEPEKEGILSSAELSVNELAINGSDKYNGDQLSPDERTRLANNVCGYDISPDMVRLSLVNMYLHGFKDPHIYEYDTLTSEDRWNEYYDIVMANPPFMSPKGGIRPHKRFSVESNRSEVLFVDYIAEHLSTNGRAAVIVPEGIIFQSGKAYKHLRKLLVEDYLVGVISLPAGVFNPYSGVKTSVLWLDRQLAKKSDHILFLKVEQDGFDLGAQRRPIKLNDLPEAWNWVKKYKQLLQIKKEENETTGFIESIEKSGKGLLIERSKIAENGDYNISGDRYKVTQIVNTQYPIFKLKDLFEIQRGGSPRPIQNYFTDDPNGINWIKIGDAKEGSKYITETKERIIPEGVKMSRMVYPGDFVLSNSMSYGRPYIMKTTGCIHDGWLLLRQTYNDLNKDYIYSILTSDLVKVQFENVATGGVVKNLNIKLVKEVTIPLPSFNLQQEIVDEIEGYQKIIDGARMVVENYKPHIDIDPEWDIVELGKLCTIKHGYAFKSDDFKKDFHSSLPIVLAPGNYKETGGLYFDERNIRRYDGKINSDYLFNVGDLTIVMTDLSPKMKILGNPAIIKSNNILHNQRIGKIIPLKDSINIDFLYYALLLPQVKNHIIKTATGTLIKHTSPTRILECEIPLPPLEIQLKIVTALEKEEILIESNRKIIEIYEQKIKDRIARVWGEEKKEYKADDGELLMAAEP